MYNIAILYLTFNRPKETEITFRQLKDLKPSKLYIAQDGPRTPQERRATESVTKIIQNVDWECEVKYLIRDQNLGCQNAVNGALDWFFENEEMGIILEDDILADPSFFYFAELMLEKFKNDSRIMLISGNNLLGVYETGYDYFFTKVGAVWGWASWRRAWKLHDKTIGSWPQLRKEKILQKILPKELADRRTKNIDEVYYNQLNTWDYQFTYSRLINSGLSIIPKVNLVNNIGFNIEATHTTRKPKAFDNIQRSINVQELKHPKAIIPDIGFDQLVFVRYNPKQSLLKRIKRKLIEVMQTLANLFYS